MNFNPRDLVAIINPRRYPGLPITPGTVAGEQTKYGVAMVRISWPGSSGWVASIDVVPVAKHAA